MFISLRVFKIFLLLIVFSPAVKIGVRSIYFFEVCLIVFYLVNLCTLLAGNRIKLTQDFLLFFLCLLITSLILFAQALLYEKPFALDFYRFFFAFSILFILRLKKNDYYPAINSVMNVSVVLAIIGVLQTFDGLVLSNALHINTLISKLYPYQGELSSIGLEKSGGVQLKLGAGSNATGTLDGQSILFGDFLVFSIVPFIYYRRYFGVGLILVALVCTFSRGAWAGAIILLFLGVFINSNVKVFKSFLVYLTLAFFLSLVVLSISSLRDYVLFRILNTLEVFGLIQGYGLGNSIDPRTEQVWPRFFSLLNENGISAYLWGFPIGVSTDSGFLYIVQNSGLVGLCLYVVFFTFVYFFRVQRRGIAGLLLIAIALLSIVHPVFQGYKAVYFIALLLFVFCIPTHSSILTGSKRE